MTPTTWTLLVVLVAMGIGFGTFMAVRGAKRKAAGALDKRTVPTPCASNGHAYRAYDTGWRCAECGNHVPRIDGEVYGPTEEGLRERRRESR